VALTKITGQVINDTTGLVVGVTTVGGGISATDGFFSGIVTAVGDASFSGNVSVGGTLTYEDVTNIDAVGLVTARNGIVVGSGITLSKDGDIFATGVTTSTTFVGDLTGNVTGAATQVTVADESSDTSCNVLYTTDATGNLAPKSGTNLTFNSSSGALTATSFVGDGSALTGIGGTDFIHAEQVSVSGIVTATAFVPTNQVFSERNKLINGKFQICQRGTSGNLGTLGSSAENYTADHWVLYIQNTSARFDVSQVTNETPDGFGHSLKIDCSTADTSLAATDEVQFWQKVEGFESQEFAKGTSSAKQYTLSFYVKVNKTGTYIVRLLGRDNTTSSCSAAYTVSDTNWNRYVVTFPADTDSNRKDDANNTESLRVVWWLVAGSGVNSGTLQTTWANSSDTGAATGQVNFADSTSNIFYITGCQLEVGPVATPFEHRKFTRDLHDCYRYYRRWQPNVNGIRSIADYSGFSSSTILSGGGLDADDAGVDRFLIPEMNHAPVVETFTDLVLVAGDAVYNTTTTVQDNYSDQSCIRLHIDNAGGMNNDTYFKRLAFNTNSGDFAVEAEI